MRISAGRITSVVLALVALASFMCGNAAAFSDSTEAAQTHGMGYIDSGLDVGAPIPSKTEQIILYSSELPARYDLREYGRVTPVRDQGDYGTCWAFSALASVESNLITNGYADGNVDLSEKHLAYYTYNYAPDKLGNTAGDYTKSPGHNYLDTGGNGWFAANTLANWEGIVLEEDMPYDTPETLDLSTVYPASQAYSMNRYHIRNIRWVPTSATEYIKRGIVEWGACEAPVYYSNTYMNIESSAYRCKNIEYTNHSVTIVGWDDNYSKDNFLSGFKPERDGAWLVRNNWGTDWRYGDEGYYWLSYEDSAFCSPENEVAFYEASPIGADYNIYQYDGSACQQFLDGKAGMLAANVFEVQDDYEVLTSVSFFTMQSGIDYEIQVYTGVTAVPDNGTAVLSSPQTGSLETGGYYSIELDEPVRLTKGEKFSIVIAFETTDGGNIQYMYDRSYNEGYWVHTSSASAGQSFYRYRGKEWKDLTDSSETGAFRIKGITEERIHPFTITDAASGITVTTSPAETVITKNAVLDVAVPELSAEAQEGLALLGSAYTVYGISLRQDGEEVHPSGEVTVAIPIPEDYTAAHTELYSVSEDGTAEAVGFGKTDEAFVFSTSCPGVYALVDTTPARLPGDTNSDGEVNLLDSTVLRRWLAGWDVTINASNADINADGKVDLKDSTILRRYLAGWSGVELK